VSKPKLFSERLRQLRQHYGWSQEELANQLGVSRNYVGMMEGGREPGGTLIKLFESLEAEMNLGTSGESLALREEPVPYRVNVKPAALPVRSVPIISWAHAGVAASYEELPLDWQNTLATTCQDKDAAAFQVEGDSMEPRCLHGDLIVVSPNAQLRNGCLVVAKFRNDGVVLRRYFPLGGTRLQLTAYNPIYPNSEHDHSEFHWIYYVHSTTRIE
jgi:SOS-response transcriptional repressor LexA